MDQLDVLLTDGEYKNTYAILRALKERKLRVGVLFNSLYSICIYSRFVDKRFFIKANLLKNSSEEEFLKYRDEVLDILKKNKISVFMPVGIMSFRFASKYKKELKNYTNLTIVDEEFMVLAQDKEETFKFAEKIGIPIPKTYYIDSFNNTMEQFDQISYPCVIKKTNFFEGGVVYCNNKDELANKLNAILSAQKFNASNPIIQEYVTGPGTGFYGIFNKGECVNYFIHERIHEYPVTGGRSSFAKSIYNDELKELGIKVLKELNWQGVAMVEFKKDEVNDTYKLMEINPKYWGSLELSYKAGINFPFLNYLIAMNKPLQSPQQAYRENVYFRWILPDDVLWNIFTNKEQRRQFKEIKKKIKIYNNLYWTDPLTIIFNLLLTFYKILTEKRYPHGRIN
jgi:predicted ATP-grasp superfamily ATP-dependent carboligase